MASRFGAIGLEVRDRREYGELPRRLYGLGRAEPVGGGALRVVWTGAGGARVESEIGGGVFHRLRVRTLGGIEVDVAAADAHLPKAPVAGQRVEGTFLMAGSLEPAMPGATDLRG